MSGGPIEPALRVRDAVRHLRQRTPDRYHRADGRMSGDKVGEDFARRFAGIPANSRGRPEHVVVYPAVDDGEISVILGLYGEAARVRGWLPGLPTIANPRTVARMLRAVRTPEPVGGRAPCQARVSRDVDLGALPVLQVTPRDAGPYLTLGVVCAADPADGRIAASVHRMLVLDRDRLTIWMLPSRHLRAMHEAAVREERRLPVSVNLGAPPAAVVASALGTRFLPNRVAKLDVAGALAGAPVAIARARTQDAPVLAESEIVLEGYLDAGTADETRDGHVASSLPEFLGYDGPGRPGLPVLTVTAVTTRRTPMYQAVLGPGREQSVILGLAGALSLALSARDPAWNMVHDACFSPAGGGLLLAFVSVHKRTRADDHRLTRLAHAILRDHPFVKLLVFVDDDVDVACEEDVWWAVTTRSNLGTDCQTLSGFPPLGMDPAQSPEWAAARGDGASGTRTVIDATVPHRLRAVVARSFPAMVGVGP